MASRCRGGCRRRSHHQWPALPYPHAECRWRLGTRTWRRKPDLLLRTGAASAERLATAVRNAPYQSRAIVFCGPTKSGRRIWRRFKHAVSKPPNPSVYLWRGPAAYHRGHACYQVSDRSAAGQRQLGRGCVLNGTGTAGSCLS